MKSRYIDSCTFLSLVSLVVSAAVFGSCSKDKAPGVTILGEDFANTHAMEAVSAAYSSKTNIRVSFVKNTFDIFDQKANEDLSEGTGQYDIILHYSSVLPRFGGKGWVLTVREIKDLYPEGDYAFEQNIFPDVWKDSSQYSSTPDGQPEIFGYPFAANTMVLVYNRQMFDDPESKARYKARFREELGVPTDWEHFKRAAAFFTDPAKSTYGVVLQGASGSPLYWEWCNFAFGMGGGVMTKNYGWQGDENTPLTLDSSETLSATRLYLQLKPYNAGDFFSTAQAEQQERMRTQKIAMAIMWSDSLYPLIGETSANRFGFAPIPGSRSMIGGGTYYLNRNSHNKRAAAKYIVDSMQPEVQVQLMKRGLCSAVSTAYSDQQLKLIPYITAVKESLGRGVYMLESGPDAGIIREVIERSLQEMWRDPSPDVSKTLQAAQREIERRRPEAFRAHATSN